jgi:hypothetical protein
MGMKSPKPSPTPTKLVAIREPLHRRLAKYARANGLKIGRLTEKFVAEGLKGMTKSGESK